VKLLYEPFEMPESPEWLDQFASQINAGVPGPDMYLVSNVEYFGRVLYNNLEGKLNRMGTSDGWDPGSEYFVVERLSKLTVQGDSLFLKGVSDTPKIGDTISRNLLEAVKEWDPEDNEIVEVPFAESFRERDGSDELIQFHDVENSDDVEEDVGDSGMDSTATTLDDFGD
jgi:hypothetical protein